ncbi:hypothetical protein Tco_0298706 [Tanacetum coccineum]
MLPSTGRVSSTNASGSKRRSNTKNDKIPQPSSRSKKNKVEAHHRKFKSSANKNNHVSIIMMGNFHLGEIILWYLDSGYSKHMTGHRDKLINFVSKFIGVYYIEGLGHNLFSVGQFCDSDLEVKFLRTKDEAPEIIIKFLKQAQVSLNATVRYLRTNNGTEFLNQTLQNYMEEAASTSAKTPTKNDWDVVFQPMFDEYFKPPSVVSTPISNATLLPSDTQLEPLLLLPLIKMPPLQTLQTCTLSIQPVSTRRQLTTDALWCYFHAFLVKEESKNYKETMIESSWIKAIQEEIHEFERLEV